MANRRETQKVPVALPEETAPERWLRGIRMSGLTLTVLALVVLALIVLAPSLKLLVEQQQEIARIQQEVDALRDDVETLEGEVDRWRDPAYIESQARDRLLYVYPGEYSYLVIDDTEVATTADGAPISDTIQTTRVDWVKSMLTSVFTAGLSRRPGQRTRAPPRGRGGVRPPFDAPTEVDVATVSAQLGRPARNVVGIAARCACGAPTVVATSPRLEDGTPFPTLYYLSHPAATAAVSSLEANGVMTELATLLDGEIADAYRAAHEAYLADRDSIEHVAELDGISAGGMPTRVKCLHALVGHSLAAGPGVNPIGDLALDRAAWSPTVCECRDYT